MACLMIAGVQSCSDSDSDGGAVGNGTVSGIVTDEQENPIDGVKVSLHATTVRLSLPIPQVSILFRTSR